MKKKHTRTITTIEKSHALTAIFTAFNFNSIDQKEPKQFIFLKKKLQMFEPLCCLILQQFSLFLSLCVCMCVLDFLLLFLVIGIVLLAMVAALLLFLALLFSIVMANAFTHIKQQTKIHPSDKYDDPVIYSSLCFFFSFHPLKRTSSNLTRNVRYHQHSRCHRFSSLITLITL